MLEFSKSLHFVYFIIVDLKLKQILGMWERVDRTMMSIYRFVYSAWRR
jgi:hypothetical protein